jgi:hypothetical protein
VNYSCFLDDQLRCLVSPRYVSVVNPFPSETSGACCAILLFRSGPFCARRSSLASLRNRLSIFSKKVKSIHVCRLAIGFCKGRRPDERRFVLRQSEVDYLHLPFAKRSSGVCVTTMHGRLDLPDLASLYLRYLGMPFVSISDAQRAPLNWLNWCATEQPSMDHSPTFFIMLWRSVVSSPATDSTAPAPTLAADGQTR